MPKSIIERYDSISAFCKALDKLPNDMSYKRNRDNNEWFGGTWEEARRNVEVGNLDVVPRANKLVDKLIGDGIELEASVWEQSVAGYLPCVPAYLSGAPDCMFVQSKVPSDTAPVRIYASACCSAGVSAKDLEKRGTTILALAMKLTAIRPVELYVYADMGGSGHAFMPCMKIETSPLDLASASYAMSHASFLRRLCFSWAEPHGWDGSWAWGQDPTSESAQKKTRAALELGDDDLLICGGYSGDPLIDSPVEWLNEQMKKFIVEHEQA
jgi:hypothetical protein